MNHSPLGMRKTMRLVIGLMILAWATQTLLHQWGYGADIPPDRYGSMATTATDSKFDQAKPAGEIQPPELDGRPQEKFVPGSARYLAGATLELRGEASLTGSDVKLRQVCRWSDADKPAFDPIADLVVMRVGGGVPFRGLSLEELKQTLSDAGVNMAVIHFAGATSCTIQRSDVKVEDHVGLEDWINARQAGSMANARNANQAAMNTSTIAGTPPQASVVNPLVAAAAAKPVAPPAADDAKPFHTLKELLIADLADRLSVTPESLQLKFNPADEKLLVLSEPHFRFHVDGRGAKVLGDVSWQVTLVSDQGNKKTGISASARAWQNQVIVNTPLAYRQTIRDSDLLDRRALVDRLSDQPLLKREQIVGQLAGRELKAGTVMTAVLVEPTPLAKAGDLVTVTVEQGRVQIKTVGRAMESGSFGQSIKVKNETTKDVLIVTLTGPQAGRMTPVNGGNTTAVGEPKIVSLDGN